MRFLFAKSDNDVGFPARDARAANLKNGPGLRWRARCGTSTMDEAGAKPSGVREHLGATDRAGK
jgi:hypothetical protein